MAERQKRSIQTLMQTLPNVKQTQYILNASIAYNAHYPLGFSWDSWWGSKHRPHKTLPSHDWRTERKEWRQIYWEHTERTTTTRITQRSKLPQQYSLAKGVSTLSLSTQSRPVTHSHKLPHTPNVFDKTRYDVSLPRTVYFVIRKEALVNGGCDTELPLIQPLSHNSEPTFIATVYFVVKTLQVPSNCCDSFIQRGWSSGYGGLW